jgi:AP-1 complex subunit gamma-1
MVKDSHQAVLMACFTLMNEICKVEPDTVKKFRKHVPYFVKSLKNLLMSGYAPEYEIGGVKDPFLQIKIIELLGRCGANNSDASDEMADVLAQIATNTEQSKNPGNSVLSECVRTIMQIEASQGLRVLGINILAKFLTNKENNVRYVALNQLMGVVDVDFKAVIRH